MKLHQLRALVTIADTGSVRGAARALNSSPAAVTQNLQQLEDCLKMQLLQRSVSGVALTDCGQSLLVHARSILAQIGRAHQAVDSMRGTPRGRLSVAVTAWVALTFLPSAISHFREKVPEVQLDLHESVSVGTSPKLRDGTLDICIGGPSSRAGDSEFCYRPLFASHYAVVVRKGHPLANSRSLSELLDQDWLFALDPETEGQITHKMFAQHGLQIPSRLHYIHSLTIALAVLQGSDMISIFPWPLIELCAERDGLCAIPVREQLDESLVGITTRNGYPLAPPANCFIDCLQEAIRSSQHASRPEITRVLHTVELL